MKPEIITTAIKVPNPSRYNYTDQDRADLKAFKENIAKELELPDNWADYLEFNTSDKFISLVEKGGYKVETFRKFLRGKQATIPADLKAKIQDHIKDEIEKETWKNKQHQKDEFYKELIKSVQKEFLTDELHIFYSHNRIEIELKTPLKEDWRWQDTLAECHILHTGEITAPQFEFSPSRRYSTISEVEQWIELKKPISALILQKAEQIKAALPAEYFTTIEAI